MAYEGKVLCKTLERESVKIPAGTYRGEIRWSEKFQRSLPYILVPSRTGIEIHAGNCPRDSGGCVLAGEEAGSACLHSSKSALERIMKVLPQDFTVIVE